MSAETPEIPWRFLLRKLQASSHCVSGSEVSQLGTAAGTLLETRVLERAHATAWLPDDCEQHCDPVLLFDNDLGDIPPGHVGVACPREPACWDGVRMYPTACLETFAFSQSEALRLLARHNGLEPLDDPQLSYVQTVGRLRRRGRSVVVLYAGGFLYGLRDQAVGALARLRGDRAIVLVSGKIQGVVEGALGVPNLVLQQLRESDSGDLELWRGLDLLDPQYRVHRRDDPEAIFDEVRFSFATEPGNRHRVTISGEDFGGFRHSDQKFLRLLLLALARAKDPDIDNGGWLPKWALQGNERDTDLFELREELARYHLTSLDEEDRKSLIKARRSESGLVRLAVDPRNIRFDSSLANFQFLTACELDPAVNENAQRRASFQRSFEIARALFLEARKRGAPLPEAPPALPVITKQTAEKTKKSKKPRRPKRKGGE